MTAVRMSAAASVAITGIGAVAGSSVTVQPTQDTDYVLTASNDAGQPYAQPLAASGGHPPYLWIGSGVPPGVELQSNGNLSGTPSARGTYAVTATIIDGATPSGIATGQWSMVVQ